MPEIDKEMIARTLNANYDDIRKKARALIEVLRKKRSIRVETEAGTNIEFRIGGRAFHGYNSGFYVKKGSWGNLPDGEVYFAPIEKNSDGVVVIDESMVELGKIREPIRMDIKAGFVTKISGGIEAEKLSDYLRPLGRDAHNIAELGIGLNEKAVITGNVLEDEKVLGTAHVALGTNVTFGGVVKAPCHMDGVMSKPSIWADDLQVIDKGKFLIDFEEILKTAVIK
jgi:leucyl aminopeptidase (aminopeptidase T)